MIHRFLCTPNVWGKHFKTDFEKTTKIEKIKKRKKKTNGKE
jgi:hypothetical protein